MMERDRKRSLFFLEIRVPVNGVGSKTISAYSLGFSMIELDEDDEEEEAEESNEPEGGKAGADVPKSAEPNEGGTPEGFMPLGADNLRRVSTQ